MGPVEPSRGSWVWGPEGGVRWNGVMGPREKRACVGGRDEVPRVWREAGNGGSEGPEIRRGWAGSGGLRVEGELGGSRGVGAG